MRIQLTSFLDTLLSASTIFMLYKFCSLVTNTELPVVVVISESMAPAFHRGDILFLWNPSLPIQVGDIPVVWFAEQDLPMVHRAVSSHWEIDDSSGEVVQHILTKGDNNDVDDVALYPGTRKTVLRREIKGVVRGYVPYVGWTVIAPKDLMQRVRIG